MISDIVLVYDKCSISGGAGKIAVKSAMLLQQTGRYNVHFLSASGPVDEELIKSGVDCICLNIPLISENKNKLDSALYGVWNLQAKQVFEDLVKTLDSKTTVVHIHGWTKALSSSIFCVVKKYNLKTIITLHDYFTVCPNGGFFNYRDARLCSLKPMSFKCLICNCDKRSYAQKIYRFIRQIIQDRLVKNNPNLHYIYISNRILSLQKKYIHSENFTYVGNPIDLSLNMSMKHQESNVFICVGRVSEEKGVEDFCKAINELRLRYNCVGRVYGTGPLLSNLRKKYKDVEFVGWVDSKKLMEIYSDARALVFPSICNEGSPLTIPEALSAGLPCIVSDSTSAADMIDNSKTGFVFNAGNVADLTEKMKKCLDDSMIKKMQIEIASTFKPSNYSYDNYVRKIIGIYERL